MLIQPFSDIHNYDLSYRPNKTNADLLICVGDFDMGFNTPKWLNPMIDYSDTKFLGVLGNHDYWNTHSEKQYNIEEWNSFYKSLENDKVSFLINETKIINGIAFIGSTLWSDFKNHDILVMNDAKISKDFNKIKYKNNIITQEEMYLLHLDARNFIIKELEKHSDKKCVVISHFPPSISCNNSRNFTPVGYYWCGQMEDVISRYQPELWLSGHMHNAFDGMMGDTRVILNPAGKVSNNVYQNSDFLNNLVIEIK